MYIKTNFPISQSNYQMILSYICIDNVNLFHFFSPILLSWIRSNDNDHSPHIYTKFHTDQLTHADSTAFHYTAVVYLDNENSQFQGGHLEFQNGPIIQPERGLAVIFTSGQENRHRVTPVHSGIRRALTFFFTCDKSYSVTNSYFAK